MKVSRNVILRGSLVTIMVVIFALSLAASTSAQSVYHMKIDGSTSVYPIISVSRYQFPWIYEGTTFDVTATNSDHGQVSILNGYVDIAVSSTPCREENEFQPTSGAFTTGEYVLSTTSSRYQCTQFEDHVVALDGIALVVNNARSCATTLLKGDLLKIWQGGYANPYEFSRIPNPVQEFKWKDIFPACTGQPFENEVIVPVAPVLGSGNRTTFATLLGVSHFGSENGWPAEETTITHFGVQRLTSAMTILIDIQSNPNHIGYVPLGYLSGVRTLALDCTSFGARSGCEEGSSSLPTKENIQNGSYPLGRNLHLLVLPQTLNPRQVIQDYLGWISGPLGQAIVENVGYMPNFPASEIPPNWDINADHIVDGFDVGIIGGYWNHGGPLDLQDPVYPIVRGWTRADISFDGKVDALDISNLSAYWNRTW